uniref:C-type lectin domain-containing protein n=1 Tax=Caenorhabditis japonica TaxID=281687 RepID=A0A8R1HWL4_CAEJA
MAVSYGVVDLTENCTLVDKIVAPNFKDCVYYCGNNETAKGDGVCPTGDLVTKLDTSTINPFTTSTIDTKTTTTTIKCPPDAGMFSRKAGWWCIEVKMSTNAIFIKSDAEALCKNNNYPVVSGLDSKQELTFVNKMAKQYLPTFTSIKSKAVWVNGERRPECYTAGRSECTGIKAFNFTDPYLSNYGGYIWQSKPIQQPDGSTENGKIQNCIVVLAAIFGEFTNSTVDDVSCSETSDVGFERKFVACGKPASYS